MNYIELTINDITESLVFPLYAGVDATLERSSTVESFHITGTICNETENFLTIVSEDSAFIEELIFAASNLPKREGNKEIGKRKSKISKKSGKL